MIFDNPIGPCGSPSLKVPSFPFLGSCPKSVVALEALWMLELVSQRGSHECAQHRASAPGSSGNVEGARFFDSLGRNAGLSERSEPTPETESVSASLDSWEIGRA